MKISTLISFIVPPTLIVLMDGVDNVYVNLSASAFSAIMAGVLFGLIYKLIYEE